MLLLWESLKAGTEYVISGSMVDKIGRAFVGKGLSKEVLNSFGVSAAENFFQEAIMEPLQETTATVFGGKDAANWDNIWERSLEAGANGILSSIILGGASIGIASAENVVNKTNPTNEEYNQAIVDTINSGEVDVKGIIEGGKQAIVTNQGMQQFYITDFNRDGNIVSIENVQGKQIENTNKDINITPVIIKNNENNYNVIDSQTGLLLDSSPYQTLIEAQSEFNNKINNLDNATINNLNSKIAQANISIRQEIGKIQSEINADRTMQSRQQNTINTNVGTNTNIDTNNIDNTYTNIDIPQQENNYNNGLNEVTKLVTQISDNSIYNREETNNIFDFITKNIPSIELQVNDNTTYLNSLDRNGNVIYQQQIPNRTLFGSEIRDIVNNAVYNADLSGTDTPLTSQNGFRGISNNETINYVSDNRNENIEQNNEQYNLSDEEIRNIVKYNQDGREISDENYVDFLVERYKDNKNISGVITDTRYVESIENKIKKDKISDLYEKIKDKEFKITKELRDENGELQNVDLDLVITKKGLNESFNK